MELDGRTREILKAIVLCYTKDVFPVGSRTITKNFNLGISPATVRNVMADLEDMGFLIQPHTSAGRVPTEKAYRYYVDHLIEEEWDSKIWKEYFSKEDSLQRTGDILGLLQETSRTLSLASHYTALVMTPRFGMGRFKQIGFVRMKRCQVMAISVTEDGLLQSRILETEEDFTQKQLNRIAKHLNHLYGGLSLEEVRRDVLTQMREVKDLYNQLMAQALTLAKKAMVNLEAGELYVEGTTNILDLPEFADAATMKGLLQIFNEKASMLKLLDSYLDAEGVQVFIGSENSLLGLSHCSLVVSNYRRGNQVLGTLGVLGPMRMEYSKVIPLVESTAKRLSHLLEEMV
jgi:heat-inducible transcriptional repressor